MRSSGALAGDPNRFLSFFHRLFIVFFGFRVRRSANSLPWQVAAAALEGTELLRSHWQSPWQVCVAQMAQPQPDVRAAMTACAAAAQWRMALQIFKRLGPKGGPKGVLKAF